MGFGIPFPIPIPISMFGVFGFIVLIVLVILVCRLFMQLGYLDLPLFLPKRSLYWTLRQ